MNIKQLLKELKDTNPFIMEQVERDSQLNYKVFEEQSIPECWVQSVLENLDKAGYVVKASQGIEKIGQVDNVVYLRPKL